ncbi:MAG: asparagine synthase (glutamine-hydrolyzing) [Acidobacteria bacterium]|nr:asparagine synthase (glutamine-hydrolyzing) [Acidobacteriota bacterium]MCA1627885.1 asparagine synthase (glutamine-hydrolyzing) [Acidobacteriota bacterium]
MCGICGVWEYGANEGSIERALIARMRDQMSHRGPDDSGDLLFDERRGGFGFRRLSIIDLSAAGHQPMHGCDERTWLVFNGEIYNHATLRAELEARGHKYASRTDSETILHAYEERGLDFIHDIEGDYAIAIWDAAREQLVLVRDRIGVKPLYYYHKDGRFIFASEIKAILQHPAVTPDIDEQSLYHYLTFLTTPAPTTLFRDIQKLPAGHVLTLKRDGALKIQQYWDALPPPKPGLRDESEHRTEILRLLRDSIRKRMMSDVPFGVFLSGGVDSSANVALMSELMSRPVETFTVGFSDAEYLNELESARRIAKQFGTNHHEVIISENEMQEFLPRLVFHQDEPIADPVCVPLFYVSQLARDSGTIVVQVGEGSDEIFSGYDNYVRHLRIYENFWRHAEGLPRVFRRALSSLSRPALEATGRKRAAIELIRRLGADEPLFWGGAVVYDETFKPRVLSESLRKRMNGLSSLRVVEPYLQRIEQERPDSDFLARMTYLELKLRLPELLLMRVDKITMATSVEARVPFLDHHLVEYALGLPRSLKVEGTTGKHILKRALEDILPHDLLYEPKRGFGAPVREWFRGKNLRGLFDARLMNSSMRKRDLLDYAFVAKMLDEHRQHKNDWGFHLWALLNLSLWYEQWID